MYIFKNAWTNIKRNIGKNILIGAITIIIIISACVTLGINSSANKLVDTYKSSNPLEVSFRLDKQSLRKSDDSEKTNFESLTVDEIKKYGDSSLVKDYYYTNEVSLSSSSVDALSDKNLTKTDDEKETNTNTETGPQMNSQMGDFRLTGYSDPSYISNFIDGTNKITSGKMFDKDSEEAVIVISEDLAEENDLKVGDSVKFYLPDDADTTFNFEIVGIYKDTSESDSSNFMGMNAMNSSNQMYTNITTVSNISDKTENNNPMSGLNAKYYLTSNDKLNEFKKEVKAKGLSDYYTISTNEEETLSAVKPISNLKSFSITFLIIIVIVGAIILTIINLINIRERKYEIGVLRSIGMSKKKLSLQIIIEMFIVALISLMLGTLIGVSTSQPITNTMLKSEINNLQEKSENVNENFGGGDFQRPGFSNDKLSSMGKNKNSNTDYVKTLDVDINIVTIGELFLVVLILTGTSGFICIMFISRFEPNKILQNRG